MGKWKAILKRFSWFIHLSIFLIFQLLFYLFDGASGWFVFNLNDGGEKAYQWMDNFLHPILPYETEQLNFLTIIWFVALILHGMTAMLQLIKERKTKNKNFFH